MSENVDTRRESLKFIQVLKKIYIGNLIGLLLCLRISMLENPVQECFIDHDMMTVRILYYAKGDFCHLLKASKQFGSRSGPTERRTWFGSKPFDIRIMLYKESIGKVNFGFKSTDDNKSTKKIHV